MNFKPLNDNVLIKAESPEEVTKSGIILPDSSEREKPEQGEVVAVGDGKTLDNGQIKKISVKKGDKVMFKKYSPDEININGEEYLVVSENDIIGIIS